MNLTSSALPTFLLSLQLLLSLSLLRVSNNLALAFTFTPVDTYKYTYTYTNTNTRQQRSTTNVIVSPLSASAASAQDSQDQTSTSTPPSTSTLETTKDGVYICTEMPPPLPTNLKNTYYLLRHGQSWGNVAGVISSARSLATSDKHGLTPLGYDQGRQSAGQLMQLIHSESESEGGGSNAKRRLFFYSSPFARARQTAEACIEGLSLIGNNDDDDNDNDNDTTTTGNTHTNIDLQEGIIIEYGLMERFFGRLDDEAIHTYAYVWPVDMFDPCHVAFEVESVAAVCTRLRETILKIEESDIHKNNDNGNGQGDIIVLTSHADVLQICQLYACGADNVGMFSSYRFTNGEVREMGRSVDTLPEPQPLEPPKPGT